MTPLTTLPSRDEVLAHGVPAEIIERLRGDARAARSRAIAAAARTCLERLRHALRGAGLHSLNPKVKAL